MSISTTREVRAIDLEVGDEIDLEDDEYGDNDMAIFGYAIVDEVKEWRSPDDGLLWLTVQTSQGEFDCPAGHWIKRKVAE